MNLIFLDLVFYFEFEQVKLIYKILNKTQKSNITIIMANDIHTVLDLKIICTK